jgi:YVTN family beta-propeller protein
MRARTRLRGAGLGLALASAAIFAVLGPQSALAATTTYTVTSTVPAGDFPWAVAVNTVTNKVYVADIFGNTVSVIDATTDLLSSTISMGEDPDAVAVDAATDKIYVAVAGTNSVAVIDGSTDTVTSTISVGTAPSAVAVDATTNTIYVVNQQSDSLSVIDGASGTVTSTIFGLGAGPEAVAVDAVTHVVYVANSSSNTVSVIHEGSLTVASTITVGAEPDALAVNATTNTVYVANENQLHVANGNTVSVIDGASGTVTSTIPVGLGASSVDLDAAKNTIYVANSQDNTVSVIDGSTGAVTFTLSPSGVSDPLGLAVDAVTNRIYIANAGSNTVTVMSLSVTPTITTTSLPDATVGTTYSSTVSASGTPAPTLTVTAGALPDGLSLDATSGLISGTPTSASSTTFTITATNATGTDEHAYTLVVDPIPAAPTITTTSLPDGLSGTAYSSTISASGFPAPTFTLADGDFIWPGLTLDGVTGVISGIPIDQGNNFFTIIATNSLGSDSREFELTMDEAPAMDTPSLPDATVGTSYVAGVFATGNPVPTYAVTAGELPDGLTLDATSGDVSGIPTTAGPASFTITATNTAGSDSVDYTVNVAPAPPVAPSITSTSTTLAGEVVGTPYSATVTASGTGPITFTLTAGELPAGLTLDATTGVVSGIPTAAGAVTFGITATNTVGSDSESFTVIVAAATPALAPTGFDAVPWGVGGMLTLVAGAALLMLASRRRRWRG